MAVEAGEEAALYAALRAIASAARDNGNYWPAAHDATKAFDGSLDAALRLHDALLPGWAWEGGSFSNAMSVYPPFYPGEDFDAPCYSGENANLPRALLLAILRALKARDGA